MQELRREAMFWEKADDIGTKAVRCLLCPHHCIIKVGERGICRGRYNHDGTLYATNYGKTIAFNIDPIEKKPLYHYHPGSAIISIGPNSCNLGCFFCQNAEISQKDTGSAELTFSDIRVYFHQYPSLPRQIAITYTEPFTWYEYIYDLAQEIPDLAIVLITNGFVECQPLQQLLPYLDAMNIDLKSIQDSFYRQHCNGGLQPVLDTIKMAHAHDVHLEITNLLIPGLNDSPQEIEELARTIAKIDREIPLHLSRYYPAYKAQIHPTEIQAVLDARKIAQKHLRWVYAGNIGYGEHYDSICAKCGKPIITRGVEGVKQNLLIDEAGKAITGCCKEPFRGKFEK
ncbi:MAG: AmmeMemoRadiSam system radical SAM enzyme [Candidatus Cloacimonetes bacterium]|nr:AmmeMemoRadiSam system radical SAM enzyme [Candidatus Cloacimonadota bacterium]